MSFEQLTASLQRAFEKYRSDPSPTHQELLHDAYLARGFHFEQSNAIPLAFWDYARADVLSHPTSFDALQSTCQAALSMRWYKEVVDFVQRALARLEEAVGGGLVGEMDARPIRRFFETMEEEAEKRIERDRVFHHTKRPCFMTMDVCALYAGMKQKPLKKVTYRGVTLEVRPSKQTSGKLGLFATKRYSRGDRVLVDPPLLACHLPETPVCDECGRDLSVYANTFTS